MASMEITKRTSRARLRDVMRGGNNFSRNSLVQETGLSAQTVNRILNDMLQSGEAQSAQTIQGQREVTRYSLDFSFRLFLCLHLESRVLRWFISDVSGQRLEEKELLCQDSVLDTLHTLLPQIKQRFPRLAAIAMSYGGMMRFGTVMGRFGQHTELYGVNLQTELTTQTGLPAVVERDIILAATGCAQSSETAQIVCIYLGETGIRAGAIWNGQPLRGASDFAGELHYLPIKNNLHYVENGFTDANLTAYYMQVVRSYAALYNPSVMILYENSLLENKIEDIRRICTRTLPEQAIPQLIVSKNFVRDCEAGLLTQARTLVEK